MIASPYPPPDTYRRMVLFYTGDEVEFRMTDKVVGTGIVRSGSNAGFNGLVYTVREDATGDDYHHVVCKRISLIARPPTARSFMQNQGGWNPAVGGMDRPLATGTER